MRGDKQFIAVIAAILASGGNHPPVNAVAKTKLLLEEVEKQFPDEPEKDGE